MAEFTLTFLQRIMIYLKVRIVVFFALVSISIGIWVSVLQLVVLSKLSGINNRITRIERRSFNDRVFFINVVKSINSMFYVGEDETFNVDKGKLSYTEKYYRVQWICQMLGIKMSKRDMEIIVNRTREISEAD